MGSTFDVDQQNLLLLFCLIATRSSNALAVPVENTDTMDQRPCEVGHQGCAGLPFPDLNWRRHAVEPRTGIEFPMILDNILTGNNNSSLSSEVTTWSPFSFLHFFLNKKNLGRGCTFLLLDLGVCSQLLNLILTFYHCRSLWELDPEQ